MDFKDSFYLTLPSNVRSPGDVENTTANYKTKLPTTIKLDDRWQVGLAEISYTKSWYNLNQNCDFTLSCWSTDHVQVFRDKKISKGHYESIEELITIIQSKIDNFFSTGMTVTYPKIIYDKNSRKIKIEHGFNMQYPLFLSFDKYLCDKLGLNYDNEELLLRKTFAKVRLYHIKNTPYDKPQSPIISFGERPVDLNAGCQSIFVYSDLIKPSIVGDSFSPILRIVEVPSESTFAKQVIISYPAPHYHSLSVNEFNTIEIHIKDDTNETIPFEFGRTIVILHFIKVY